MSDRVGLGWRPELAAGILAHLDAIDVVELLADDLFDTPRARLRAMRGLAARLPVVLHGVGMGLASVAPVAPRRLERMARLVDLIQPAFWSEHLAFVRAAGIEIGHLAAPPRTRSTVEGAARNIERARAIVGTAPLLENVATLLEPPGSEMDEAGWTAAVLEASDGALLLDLHNLHANAFNFDFDAVAFLDRIPAERVRSVHLAGGRPVTPGARAGTAAAKVRILDDHRHDVPDPVYALLQELGRRCAHPLTVILERDGAYPPIQALLAQLARARAALSQGRALRFAAAPYEQPPGTAVAAGGARAGTTAALGEELLARLYVDRTFREWLLSDPRGAARRLGLTDAQAQALATVDRAGLALAAESFARKRAASGGGPPGVSSGF